MQQQSVTNSTCIELRSMETKEGSTAVSRKRAAQERRAAEKKERNRLNYQQNREKIIERVKERRRAIHESTTERIKHTKRSRKRKPRNRVETRHVPRTSQEKQRSENRRGKGFVNTVKERKYKVRMKPLTPDHQDIATGRQRSVEQIK